MERLTDHAQGYCEMYCKKYGRCFGDPGDCDFEKEVAMYEALKSIEGIVPFDRLLQIAQADKDGRLEVLPCKLHESIFYLEDGNWFEDIPYEVNLGERPGEWKDSLLFTCEDGFNFYEDDIGKTVFLTREEAEAALTDTNVGNMEGGGE